MSRRTERPLLAPADLTGLGGAGERSPAERGGSLRSMWKGMVRLGSSGGFA